MGEAQSGHQVSTRMTKSVHDNFIIGYEVHCERREIRLLTEYRDRGTPFERTVVLFTDVEAYHFEHDCFGNIVLDIEEIPAETILTQHQSQFEEGRRLAGWPRFWEKSFDDARSYLREHGIRGFELSSSCGMSVWVLAQDMQMLDEGSHVA
jgi:hypothetical protein